MHNSHLEGGGGGGTVQRQQRSVPPPLSLLLLPWPNLASLTHRLPISFASSLAMQNLILPAPSQSIFHHRSLRCLPSSFCRASSRLSSHQSRASITQRRSLNVISLSLLLLLVYYYYYYPFLEGAARPPTSRRFCCIALNPHPLPRPSLSLFVQRSRAAIVLFPTFADADNGLVSPRPATH